MEPLYAYIATINIGTLNDKEEEVVQLIQDKKIKLIGLAETRTKGKGRKTLHNNYEIVYSGEQNSTRNGVAIVMEPSFAKHIEKIDYVSGRIVAVTLNINGHRTSFIQAYAPQQGRSIQEKLDFYEDLERTFDRTPADSDKIIMGDLNGHVGNTEIEDVVGHFGIGEKNMEGELIIDFCRRNNLTVMNTFFKHQESHIYTWYRYNYQTNTHDQKSQIDFILSNNEKIIADVKAFPGLSLDADHRLLRGKLKLHQPPTETKTKQGAIYLMLSKGQVSTRLQLY